MRAIEMTTQRGKASSMLASLASSTRGLASLANSMRKVDKAVDKFDKDDAIVDRAVDRISVAWNRTSKASTTRTSASQGTGTREQDRIRLTLQEVTFEIKISDERTGNVGSPLGSHRQDNNHDWINGIQAIAAAQAPID